MRTLVIGLGNPILTDDGVGVKVAYAVEEALAGKLPEEVVITEASAGGLRLMEAMVGFDKVILIDAIILPKDNKPGRIHQMTIDDLRVMSPTQHSASAHDTSLVTALDMGKRMELDLPEEIHIYAVEVENIIDFSEEPTPAVADAIPIVTTAVLEELGSILKETK
jgi:hydrogenase maturation protease